MNTRGEGAGIPEVTSHMDKLSNEANMLLQHVPFAFPTNTNSSVTFHCNHSLSLLSTARTVITMITQS